jgi:DNA polymerase III epsilon subunit-like protein
MKHLNGHVICAIDCETTGLEPFFHDIIQIAILPLDFDLKPDGDILPFECKLKPRRPENIDAEAIKHQRNNINDVIVHGLDPDFAADLFTEWFEALPCREGKRIMPLAHNWPFDCTFIEDWLGHEHYQYIFDGRFRDTMSVANFLNDVADFQVENYPFPKQGLQYLVRCLGIDFDPTQGHDAVYDAAKTAEVYRTMVQHNYIDLRHPLV